MTISARRLLKGALKYDRWKQLLIDTSTKMTKIKWLASKHFNHFVINHVMDDPGTVSCRIIRLCFVVSTDTRAKQIHRIVIGYMKFEILL